MAGVGIVAAHPLRKWVLRVYMLRSAALYQQQGQPVSSTKVSQGMAGAQHEMIHDYVKKLVL